VARAAAEGKVSCSSVRASARETANGKAAATQRRASEERSSRVAGRVGGVAVLVGAARRALSAAGDKGTRKDGIQGTRFSREPFSKFRGR
jgi:hypothetical protein